jgi:hypothetical protein
MEDRSDEQTAFPIPPSEEAGDEYYRDGFTAAYLYRRGEDRLFLLDPCGTMSEIRSPDMRALILEIGERIGLEAALLLLAADHEAAAAIA